MPKGKKHIPTPKKGIQHSSPQTPNIRQEKQRGVPGHLRTRDRLTTHKKCHRIKYIPQIRLRNEKYKKTQIFV
jgi:hypothetical protein